MTYDLPPRALLLHRGILITQPLVRSLEVALVDGGLDKGTLERGDVLGICMGAGLDDLELRL